MDAFFPANTVRRFWGLVALLFAVFCAAGTATFATNMSPDRPVPKAQCAPTDRTESVQGETTLAERFRPGAPKAYNCNLHLFGQYTGEGAGDTFIPYDKVAFMAVAKNFDTRHPGVTVIDVSDPRQPRVTDYLETPAMLDANESLAVSKSRKLLLAGSLWRSMFDIYDLSKDPLHPSLIFSGPIPGAMTHMGEFSANGRIYFGAGLKVYLNTEPAVPPSAAFAIDVSDAAHPKVIDSWIPTDKTWQTHGLWLSRDGNRAYISLYGNAVDLGRPSPNGFVILDTSDFVSGRPNPKFRMVSSLMFPDTDIGQDALPVTIGGKTYVVFADTLGSLKWTGSSSPPASACNTTKPAFGSARLIDVSDENHPKVASRLTLEVSGPSRCSQTRLEPIITYGYGAVICDANNPEDATLIACGYWEAGVRVFDVRDPTHPKEIAYYKPPAVRKERRAGAPNLLRVGPGGKDRTADEVLKAMFRDSGREIWFLSWDNGFQVLRFSDDFIASNPDLFPK